MDINLKGKEDGIQTAIKIKAIEDIPIIFITAFVDNETVERAKAARPSAYLVKPFNDKELNIAITLAVGSTVSKSIGINDKIEVSEVPLILNEFIFVRNNTRFEKLDINDILWIEASGNYSVINTEKNKFTLICTIGQLLEKLSNTNILRVHKSFLINLKKVKAFEEHRVFIGDQEIPLSRTYKEDFYKHFKII